MVIRITWTRVNLVTVFGTIAVHRNITECNQPAYLMISGASQVMLLCPTNCVLVWTDSSKYHYCTPKRSSWLVPLVHRGKLPPASLQNQLPSSNPEGSLTTPCRRCVRTQSFSCRFHGVGNKYKQSNLRLVCLTYYPLHRYWITPIPATCAPPGTAYHLQSTGQP